MPMKRWPSAPWSGQPLDSGTALAVMPRRSTPPGAWARARSQGSAAASGAANRARRLSMRWDLLSTDIHGRAQAVADHVEADGGGEDAQARQHGNHRLA